MNNFKRNLVPLAICALGGLMHAAAAERILIGTYTGTGSEGIYAASFDADSGKLGAPMLAVKTPSPSFVIRDAKGLHAYAVNESSGTVTAFSVNAKTGALTELNHQETHGDGPCHLAIDRAGKILVVANYSSGSIASYPVGADGGLGKAAYTETFQGPLGPVKERQERSHAHSATFAAADTLLLVNDLGGDATRIYKVDAAAGKLTPAGSVAARPGAGPRHLVLSRDERFVYVLNEITSSVTVFEWVEKPAKMREVQSVSTLPAGFQGQNTDAEIAINGRFLYASNRGHDSISVFSIDKTTGQLAMVQTIGSGGQMPRSFAFDGTGRWLLAANQKTGNVVVFEVAPKTGTLRATGASIQVAAAVCVNFPGGK